MKIDDAIVEVDAVDCMGHGYIEVYKMDAHNKAQKADDMLGEEISLDVSIRGIVDNLMSFEIML